MMMMNIIKNSGIDLYLKFKININIHVYAHDEIQINLDYYTSMKLDYY